MHFKLTTIKTELKQNSSRYRIDRNEDSNLQGLNTNNSPRNGSNGENLNWSNPSKPLTYTGKDYKAINSFGMHKQGLSDTPTAKDSNYFVGESTYQKHDMHTNMSNPKLMFSNYNNDRKYFVNKHVKKEYKLNELLSSRSSWEGYDSKLPLINRVNPSEKFEAIQDPI